MYNTGIIEPNHSTCNEYKEQKMYKSFINLIKKKNHPITSLRSDMLVLLTIEMWVLGVVDSGASRLCSRCADRQSQPNSRHRQYSRLCVAFGWTTTVVGRSARQMFRFQSGSFHYGSHVELPTKE